MTLTWDWFLRRAKVDVNWYAVLGTHRAGI